MRKTNSTIRPMVRKVFLLSCLALSCSAVPENRYFTLAYSLIPATQARPAPLPLTVRIRQLDVNTAYDQDRMVYRYSPYEFQYYNYMLWAVKPQKMVTDMLIRHLEYAQVFQSIARDFGEARPDFELTGTLEAIEELDSGEEWFAHIAFQVQLTHFGENRVIWSGGVDARKRVYNKAPVYVVKALSELMEEESEKLAKRMREMLAKEKPRAGSEP